MQRFQLSLNRAEFATLTLPWNDPRFQVCDSGRAPAAAANKADATDEITGQPSSYAHAVYLGVGPKQRFVDFILRTHAIAPTDEELYRPASGQGWLAAFIAGANGVPLAKTYVAASFAVGSSLLQQQRTLDDMGASCQLAGAGQIPF